MEGLSPYLGGRYEILVDDADNMCYLNCNWECYHQNNPSADLKGVCDMSNALFVKEVMKE
jgi:hypothetical protein